MVGITLHKTLHAALATLSDPKVGEVTEEDGLTATFNTVEMVADIVLIPQKCVVLIIL